MLRKYIKDTNFVVFDVETTGFKPVQEQMIEIGAVKVDLEGKVLDKFSAFISLYKKSEVPEKIVELTTITTQQLAKEGRDISDVMIDFMKFCKGSILVAQNAKFDMSFIAGYFIEEKRQTFSNICLDTINFAKILRPFEETYKLSHLVELFGVDYDADAHHRADYDAQITAEVLIAQLKELNVTGEMLIKELIQLENVELITPKQEGFLNSLIERHSIIINKDDFYTKYTASSHIDIMLNLK